MGRLGGGRGRDQLLLNILECLSGLLCILSCCLDLGTDSIGRRAGGLCLRSEGIDAIFCTVRSSLRFL